MTAASARELLKKLADIDARARAVTLDLGGADEQKNEQILVAFEVCGTRFLTRLGDLREIIYVPSAITPVPRIQQWLRGVANVRGSLLPIVDLQRFLCDTEQLVSADNRILIVEREGLFVGLQVPAVYGLRHVPREAAEGVAPPGTGAMSDFVDSGCVLEGETWPVFSIDALVQHPKFRVASV